MQRQPPIRRFEATFLPLFIVPLKERLNLTDVTDIAKRLLDLGVHDVSIGDTIGKTNV